MKPLHPGDVNFWSNHVAGVVDQYMAEIKHKLGCDDDEYSISFDMAG